MGAWSDDHVRRVTRDFLTRCDWALGDDDGWICVPPDAELVVLGRALILSEHGFGDHVTVIVYLGVNDPSSRNPSPLHEVLRLYLNADGRMITEDRYSPADWRDRRP